MVVLRLLLLGGVSVAQTEAIVDAESVILADIVPSVEPRFADIEIAAAPPPGGSRLLSRDEVERVLSRAGVAPGSVALPAAVRVTAAVMRKSEAEVEAWLRPAVEAALPTGATLTKLSATRPLLTSPSATLGRVTLPRFPRRSGEFRSTVVAEIGRGGTVLQRVTLSFVARLSDEAAKPDVERGAPISLVIETAGATLTATAAAMESGNVGETRMFRVTRTGKVLRARIESRHSARVVAP
jgi:hypothetical protein